MTGEPLKACVACKYFSRPFCVHLNSARFDPVEGPGFEIAEFERASSADRACQESGRNWKAREPSAKAIGRTLIVIAILTFWFFLAAALAWR